MLSRCASHSLVYTLYTLHKIICVAQFLSDTPARSLWSHGTECPNTKARNFENWGPCNGLVRVLSRAKSKARDRRAALDDAEGDEEREAVNKACPMLPEKPGKLYGCVSALTPKEDERVHGEGATRASLYSQAKKKLKLKTAASRCQHLFQLKTRGALHPHVRAISI